MYQNVMGSVYELACGIHGAKGIESENAINGLNIRGANGVESENSIILSLHIRGSIIWRGEIQLWLYTITGSNLWKWLMDYYSLFWL